MWSVGVVFAYLLGCEDLFKPRYEERDDPAGILDQVFGLLGAPSEVNAPCILRYPHYEQ
jgi:hypothetical protein